MRESHFSQEWKLHFAAYTRLRSHARAWHTLRRRPGPGDEAAQSAGGERKRKEIKKAIFRERKTLYKYERYLED